MSLQPGDAPFHHPGRHHPDAVIANVGCGIDPLAAIGTFSRFGRNQTVFAEGDPASHSFKIVSGAVRLCKVLADGRRQIADFRLPGDFFGLEGGEEYGLTAEALSDTIVVRYARSRLDRLGQEQPTVQQNLMQVLKRELMAAQTHLTMLGRQSAKERVASFLIQLAETRVATNGDTVELPMGRQDMADYLGLTIETVCRAISDMKRDRIVSVPDRHHVVLRNVDALAAVADGDE